MKEKQAMHTLEKKKNVKTSNKDIKINKLKANKRSCEERFISYKHNKHTNITLSEVLHLSELFIANG